MAAGKSIKLTKKILKQFQSELGYTQETIKNLTEQRIAKALHKLELGDRPRARLEYERSALLDDSGKIPDDSLNRAFKQLTNIRAQASTASREIANMPTGTTLFSVDARTEAPTAGLNADNTGWTALGPGNIGGRKKIKAVADCAKDLGIPIRIGVNSGSLEKDILKKYKGITPEAMVESALRQIERLKSLDFHEIKISLKASDVRRTVEAYRLLSARTDLPLHVGITEAGALFSGIVKSALGIGMLLAEGIGDTLRVSLTRDPVEEVRVGYEILRALNIRHRGPEIISCPTCGRCKIGLFDIVEQVENALSTTSTPIKIAIMGCVVNGPGEAREADIGIAGGDGNGVLFRKGKVIKKFPQEKLVEVLLEEVARYENSRKKSERVKCRQRSEC